MPRRTAAIETAGAARPVTSGRVEIVDAARGFAITMMIAYHFCFDLTYFGWTSWSMLDDERWVAWRTMIVTSFLVLVGVSLALREARERQVGGAGWLAPAFVRRWGQVAAAAALVTAGSLALFPERFIYFGVLQFVALALWLCRRTSKRPTPSIVLGGVAIASGTLLSNSAFDPPMLNWIGFAVERPLTEDYVPVFPWIGVVLIGCGLGGVWVGRGHRLWAPLGATWRSTPHWLKRTLTTMGRWSLTTYLVHQPLMLGAMALIRRYA